MKGGYESLIWIKDKNGKEYACYLDDFKKKDTDKEIELTDEQLKQCIDVSQILGTERW